MDVTNVTVLLCLSIITSTSLISASNTVSSFKNENCGTGNNHTKSIINLCIGNCDSLPAFCYSCNKSDNCNIGYSVKFNCSVNENAQCTGPKTMQKTFLCQYCYLTKESEEHTCCQQNMTCKVNATPKQKIKANCTVNDDVFCLGKRTFSKMMSCSWTKGYSWSTTLILSVTFGGFGIDRFYLGYWKEGLGKFFSFGGLGVWTLIDVVLVGTGYLGPSDGSLYVH